MVEHWFVAPDTRVQFPLAAQEIYQREKKEEIMFRYFKNIFKAPGMWLRYYPTVYREVLKGAEAKWSAQEYRQAQIKVNQESGFMDLHEYLSQMEHPLVSFLFIVPFLALSCLTWPWTRLVLFGSFSKEERRLVKRKLEEWGQ